MPGLVQQLGQDCWVCLLKLDAQAYDFTAPKQFLREIGMQNQCLLTVSFREEQVQVFVARWEGGENFPTHSERTKMVVGFFGGFGKRKRELPQICKIHRDTLQIDFYE